MRQVRRSSDRHESVSKPKLYTFDRIEDAERAGREFVRTRKEHGLTWVIWERPELSEGQARYAIGPEHLAWKYGFVRIAEKFTGNLLMI